VAYFSVLPEQEDVPSLVLLMHSWKHVNFASANCRAAASLCEPKQHPWPCAAVSNRLQDRYLCSYAEVLASAVISVVKQRYGTDSYLLWSDT
jgi:hypothetical protein